MLNDKIETLKKVSNVIVGHAAYNTVFESIKYDDVVPDYNPVFDYKWEGSESGNIVTMTCNDVIDCAGTIDRSSSLTFKPILYYYIDNDELTQIQINITNIKSNYSDKAIIINDFINNIVQYFMTGSFSIFDEREYIGLAGGNERSKINLSKNAKIAVGFKRDDNTILSVRSLFINDLVLSYTLEDRYGVVESVSKYSEVLGKNLKYLIANQNTEKADLFKLVQKAEEVDIDKINDDFKSKEDISGAKDYLFNTVLHKIIRSGYATLADIMSLHDGTELELTSINYIVNL